MDKSTITDLASAVMKELNEYSEEVEEKVKKNIDSMADRLLEKLKTVGDYKNISGKYRKSFYKKTLAEGKGYKRVVLASKDYRKTHLLENGHVMRQGGRSKAYPHWAEAEAILKAEYEDVVKGV